MWPVSGTMSNLGSREQDVWEEGVRLKGTVGPNRTGAHMERVASHN